MVGLTRALAKELGAERHGQHASCRARSIPCAALPPAATRDAPPPDNLMGRPGKPEEIAEMVRYLCSPAARFITGQTIHVNGGAFMP